MPELPEVEIVRQSLNKKINGKIIKKVIVKNRNLRFKIPLNFTSILKNKRIIKVDRFSKYLIIFLSNDHVCLIHLGMSGTIHLVNKKRKNFITNTSFYHSPTLPKKHNHVEIFFDDLKFIYNDPRRFGYFEIIQNFELLKNKINKFGPEPFSVKFNFDYLHSFLKNKEKNIKNFLLDQRFVSGIGNIYASEILYLSKIKPDISPIEASLSWALSKMKKEEGNFLGSKVVKDQIENGVKKKRVGIKPDKIIAREGSKIFKDDKEIGVVTSGGFGPSVNGPVAMGYVLKEFANEGETLELEVRGKKHQGKVFKMPFYKKSYVK